MSENNTTNNEANSSRPNNNNTINGYSGGTTNRTRVFWNQYIQQNSVITFNQLYSRFHSARENARIRAAMEREYLETGGGEYDTDISDYYDSDEDYDEYLFEGESKTN